VLCIAAIMATRSELLTQQDRDWDTVQINRDLFRDSPCDVLIVVKLTA
jgi:hypothetical protein